MLGDEAQPFAEILHEIDPAAKAAARTKPEVENSAEPALIRQRERQHLNGQGNPDGSGWTAVQGYLGLVPPRQGLLGRMHGKPDRLGLAGGDIHVRTRGQRIRATNLPQPSVAPAPWGTLRHHSGTSVE